MTLQDMIADIRGRVDRGEIDQHEGNLATSQVLAQARKELVDATQSVLSQFNGESGAKSSPPQRPNPIPKISDVTMSEWKTEQPKTSQVSEPVDDTIAGDGMTSGSMTIDEFLLKWSIVLRNALDGYIKTRTDPHGQDQG